MRKILWFTIFVFTTAFLPHVNAATNLGSPIALKAWNELQKNSPKTYSKNLPNVTFVVAPNSDLKKVNVVENQVIFILHYYEKYLPASTPITIYIWDSEKDREWYDASLRAGINKGSYDATNLNKRFDSGASGPSQDGSQAMELLEVDIESDQYPYVLYHEITHITQFVQTNAKTMPCWIREGMATYNGFAIESRISQPVYINSMVRIIQRGLKYSAGDVDYKKTNPTFWIDYFKENETRSISKCSQPQDYAIGAMGFQYLTGTFGFDKVYKFLKGLDAAWKPECNSGISSGLPCSSWKDVFTKTFGISPDTAYSGFGTFIVDQIAWASKQTIQSDLLLRKKYPQNYAVPSFELPKIQIRSGAPCAKENEKGIANKVEVKCFKISEFLFWSVAPVSSTREEMPSPNNNNQELSPTPSPTPSQNPDDIFGPNGLCDIEGQYLPTEKGEVLLCTPNGGKLRWVQSADPLPINGIYPGMKCDPIGQILIGGTGKNVECVTVKNKNVWIYRN